MIVGKVSGVEWFSTYQRKDSVADYRIATEQGYPLYTVTRSVASNPEPLCYFAWTYSAINIF